jgi:hypothetical protein
MAPNNWFIVLPVAEIGPLKLQDVVTGLDDRSAVESPGSSLSETHCRAGWTSHLA